jgi:hypothetical protein
MDWLWGWYCALLAALVEWIKVIRESGDGCDPGF